MTYKEIKGWEAAKLISEGRAVEVEWKLITWHNCYKEAPPINSSVYTSDTYVFRQCIQPSPMTFDEAWNTTIKMASLRRTRAMKGYKDIQGWEAAKLIHEGKLAEIEWKLLNTSTWHEGFQGDLPGNADAYTTSDIHVFRQRIPTKTRPMGFEELPPVGTPVRCCLGGGTPKTRMISTKLPIFGGVHIELSGSSALFTVEDLVNNNWLFSLDCEKTWQPFTVEIEE